MGISGHDLVDHLRGEFPHLNSVGAGTGGGAPLGPQFVEGGGFGTDAAVVGDVGAPMGAENMRLRKVVRPRVMGLHRLGYLYSIFLMRIKS